MAETALIVVDEARADDLARPAALLRSGGLTILERQLRQVKRLGIAKVLILAADFAVDVEASLAKTRMGPVQLRVLRSTMDLAAVLPAGEAVLLIDGPVLLDDRLLDAVWQAQAATVLAAFAPKGQIAPEHGARRVAQEGRRIDFAGVAKLPGALVAASASQAGKGALVPGLLASALGEKNGQILDPTSLPLYIPNHRRAVPLLWHRVSDMASAARGTEKLLAMAQKGCLDWPARFFHPPIEDFLTRCLLPTSATPNQITLITGLLGFFVTYLFASGQLLAATLGALLIGPLDGVDGKLARVKMATSRMGELEHVLDKIVEYSWYFALAFALAAGPGGRGVYGLALLVVLFAWAEVVQGEFFRRMTGRQLDDAGAFERAIRLIAGRRNTFIWALLPFGLAGAWTAGLWLLAFYSALTFFVAQWRFILRTREFLSGLSPVIARNFRLSAYFAPSKKTLSLISNNAHREHGELI
ncbi:MAG: CDP-alcohol phosphatidyltransferase family protein [Pseudomonadota bacterium]